MFSLWVKDLIDSYWKSITKHASIFYNISFQNFVPFETFQVNLKQQKNAYFYKVHTLQYPDPQKTTESYLPEKSKGRKHLDLLFPLGLCDWSADYFLRLCKLTTKESS